MDSGNREMNKLLPDTSSPIGQPFAMVRLADGWSEILDSEWPQHKGGAKVGSHNTPVE